MLFLCYNIAMAQKTAKLSRLTGTAIPVAALKTGDSCGAGEFLDLLPFADFCKSANLELIQLLPVNDTGTESSPYSALSAFALHPIYMRLQALPEAEPFLTEITELKQKHDNAKRFNYKQLRNDKLELLSAIFNANAQNIIKDDRLAKWIESHQWVKAYAVFMQKKRENFEANWQSWSNGKNASAEEIESAWNDKNKQKEHYFFAWMQMRLDEQFTKAAEYVKAAGIILKGDIPIMMNEDSADAWANPEFFNMNLRAGAPADGYNPTGQNWGFPIYNWKNLKACDYSWWKERLKAAEKYYKAYRIDHVLGFFRIWAVPQGERTAVLGYPQPLETISAKELEEIGFSAERLRWLSKPHIETRQIEEVNNFDYLGTHGELQKIMNRIGTEEMWLFKDSIKTDSDIYSADMPDSIKNRLAELWRNRCLIEVSKNKYTPTWAYRDSTAWQSLNEQEKTALQELIEAKQGKMEKAWEKQAKNILGDLTKSVDMIPCAEDLGANPESVPRVMGALNILSLRIVRWTREWNKDGQPYVMPEDYPSVSVAANSVHDSSTIRGWWLNENAGKDFIRDFGEAEGVDEETYTPQTAEYVLKNIAKAQSAFCIHPLQDLLHLNARYYDDDCEAERVNVPGSVTEFNWTYRLPCTIDQLASDKELINSIKELCKLHKK